jgi:hypothetical protein
MQEHIRRAHPEHYISKLPATEESFQLMINTPPSERPPPPTSSNLAPHGLYSFHKYSHGLLTVIKDMETTDTATMAKTQVLLIRPGRWTISNLVLCCQPLAPQQRWHSCTTTNSREMTGSRKGLVISVLKNIRIHDC